MRGAAYTETQKAHFDTLFESDPDPWGYRTSWAEEAKRRAVRGALVAALQGRRGCVLELGCGNGESTAALLPYARSLVAIDGARHAVMIAKTRIMGTDRSVEHAGRVAVIHGQLPRDMPQASFDAVVATEVLYYLPAPDVHAVLDRLMRPLGRAEPEPRYLIATSSTRSFSDRALSHETLTTLLERRLGLAIRTVCGGAWQTTTYELR